MVNHRMNGILIMLSAAFFISFIMASCQSIQSIKKPAKEEISGEYILKKHIAAVGGRKRLEKIHNRKVKINLNLLTFRMEIPLTVYQEQPNYYYSVADMMRKAEAGTDGNVVWEINPMTGPSIKEGKERANLLIDYSFNPILSWKEYFKNAVIEGMEDVKGKQCFKVILTPFEGSERTYYFDKDSFLIVKTAMERKTAFGDAMVETYLDDYREVDGVLGPFKFETYQMGQAVMAGVIESLETNIEMPEGVFDFPEKIRELIKAR